MIPIASSAAPRSPNANRITAEAGVVVCANPAGPKARTHTKFTARYSAITPSTPKISPRGRFFRGSRTSPAIKFAVCHPPKEKSTGVSAAPNAVNRSIDTGRSSNGRHSPGGGCTSSQPTSHQSRNRQNFQQHQNALHRAARSHSKTINQRQQNQRQRGHHSIAQREGASLPENTARR